MDKMTHESNTTPRTECQMKKKVDEEFWLKLEKSSSGQ